MKFRDLRADEIECRIKVLRKDGLSLLLYKDARCDMNILDETVGAENWQRHHSRDNANCIVSIWDENKKQWIEKEDVGTESNTEAEKGIASDSFKRSCVCWGIGRELYTAPFIWVSLANCNIVQKQESGYKDKDKYECKDKFIVSAIEIKDKKITSLEITNLSQKKVCFTFGKNVRKLERKAPDEQLAVKCNKCGKPIKSATAKDGTVKTAQEVKDACGGLCLACWKAERQEVKNEAKN